MKCEYCNSDNKEGALFCASCGKKLQENTKQSKKFCVNCGKPLKEDAVFCPSCGGKVKQQMPSSVDVSSDVTKPTITVQTSKKDKKKIVIGIVIALIAVVAYIGVWLFLLRDEIFDLEEYMSKDKQEWIDVGFQGEDDFEVYNDGNDTTIIFDEGKPYILTIEKSSISSFHGVKIEDAKAEVKDKMKDSYETLEESEDELAYKHRNKELWVAFEMEGEIVNKIVATTDGTLLNVTDDWFEDEISMTDEGNIPEDNISETMDLENAPDFSGSWVDPISQRCNMEIVCQNDTYYEITVDWGSSAWDNTHWEFTGEYDASQGGIVYKNGCRYEQYYPEDGGNMQQTEVYSDGEGFIYIEDGELYWEDKKEGTGEAQTFVRSDVLETLNSEKFPDAEYILPDSDTIRLTEDDIADLSLQEINYAKNEIYARHGRKFQSQELRDYFNSKDWYIGTIDGADFDDGVLSQIERDNIKLLTNAEFSMDSNGYQLDQ